MSYQIQLLLGSMWGITTIANGNSELKKKKKEFMKKNNFVEDYKFNNQYSMLCIFWWNDFEVLPCDSTELILLNNKNSYYMHANLIPHLDNID